MDWKALLTSLAFGALMCPVLAQNQTLPRLHDMDPKGRQPFLVQGCHADVCSHDGGPRTKVLPAAQNYDMGPSIARSDSFDVQHYDLFLDVTDYGGQHLDAHATIDFTVLQGFNSNVEPQETIVFRKPTLIVQSGRDAMYNIFVHRFQHHRYWHR